LTCSTMFLVPNIDQMYKEMKKIVEVGNKHGNGDEFPDFVDLFFFFFFDIKNVRVGSNILGLTGNTHIFFFGLSTSQKKYVSCTTFVDTGFMYYTLYLKLNIILITTLIM
jgi:hypothetical protein